MQSPPTSTFTAGRRRTARPATLPRSHPAAGSAPAHPRPPGPTRRRRPSRRVRRRRAIALAVLCLVVVLGFVAVGLSGGTGHPHAAAVRPSLPSTAFEARIVTIAEHQVGYRSDPKDSYCNKFSAYWGAGRSICPSGERSEEWCADFAAWVWHGAGLSFSFGFRPGEINGAAVSFYEWAVANGEWHPAVSGYVASPGDVAVYGLSLEGNPSAAHVAVVTSGSSGSSGPDVINGDGNQTGFSVVETGTGQLQVHVGQNTYPLSGYVSP